MKSSGLVTPEAVLLEFETASIGSRTLALAVDLAVQASLFIVVQLAVASLVAVLGLPAWLVISLLVVEAFAVVFGYPVAMETLRDGRSIGKSVLGLRVVTVEGAPVRFRHAAIRSALQIVDFLLPPIGVLAVGSVLLSSRNQRLGDLAAGTVVLRERTSQRASAAVAFPPLPGYEQYVSSLDVAALTPEQYRLLRSFLTRVYTFSPGARAALATRLAQPLTAVLHHTPPPGVNPETFLASVAAAYQLRHGGTPFEVPQWAAPGPRAPMAVPSDAERAQTPEGAPPAPEPPPPVPPGGDFTPPA